MTEGSAANQAAFKELFGTLSNPTQLLDCILEIGTEKLKRDYSSHLVGEELCTGRHLEKFFEAVGGSSAETLARLHNVMELFSVSKSYVDVAHTSLRELVTDALAHYQSNTSESLPIFCMALPAFSESALKVKRLCGTVEPARWSVRVGGKAPDSDAVLASYSQRRSEILPEIDAEDNRGHYASPVYYHTLSETTVAAV
jgi:hypothetical protein